MNRYFLLVLAALAWWPFQSQAAATRATLLLSAQVARPGDTITAAIRLQMNSGWHTYWKSGGDSGGPSKVAWQLPPGVTAGEIQWPPPEKYEAEGLITYVYHDEAVLLVPLKLGADLPPGPLEIQAKVSWLECEKLCLPGQQDVSASLTIGAQTTPGADAELIAAALKRLPKDGAALNPRATWDGPGTADTRALLLEWTSPVASERADFFPEAHEGFDVGTTAEPAGNNRLRLMVTKYEGDWPGRINGLIQLVTSNGTEAFAVSVPIQSAAPPGASPGTAPAPVDSRGTPALGLMLLYAFIGGLILNIMPCVLPVIALKILGFVGQAKESPGRVRQLGLVYALGVLVSFLGLAALVIGVKSAGQAAGWGMQFSSPQFTIAFAALVTLVALNLFGVFEVTLGGGVLNAAGELASRHGASGAFFNGVLATVLATPCTAPFLSVALGFAFSQSAAIVVLVFLTVGLGLASPYVLLSWFPAWLKWLPKPGVWMEHFKIAMGFPMLATGLWLASLVTDHYGERSWWLGIFLLFLALAAWIFGTFIQRGEKRKGLAGAFLFAVLALGYLWALEDRLQWRQPLDPKAAAGATVKNAPKGYAWERWSAEAVRQARAVGRPVVVDFTAKWCITCNSIVKPAFEREAVVAELKSKNVAALVADYSDYGADITAAMKEFNRAAVPLVVVFPADAGKAPIVLPDPNPILGPGAYATVIVEALRGVTK